MVLVVCHGLDGHSAEFLLAILMDAYARVKEKSLQEMDLMKQIDTMMRRRSQNKAKERVKLGYIFQTYFQEVGDEKTLLKDTTYVTPSDVMAKVKGLPKSQAQRTISGAKAQFAEDEPEYSPENVRKDMEWMNARTQSIRNEVEVIRSMIQKYDSKINFGPKTTSSEVEKSVPPRRQIVDTVHDEIGHLGDSINVVLSNEMETFSQQHRELETNNRNMLAQMQDTTRVMASIRAQTDAIRQDTQRHAIVERRNFALQSKQGQKTGINFAACMAPAVEAPPLRPR